MSTSWITDSALRPRRRDSARVRPTRLLSRMIFW
jgi:hypothetical protein